MSSAPRATTNDVLLCNNGKANSSGCPAPMFAATARVSGRQLQKRYMLSPGVRCRVNMCLSAHGGVSARRFWLRFKKFGYHSVAASLESRKPNCYEDMDRSHRRLPTKVSAASKSFTPRDGHCDRLRLRHITCPSWKLQKDVNQRASPVSQAAALPAGCSVIPSALFFRQPRQHHGRLCMWQGRAPVCSLSLAEPLRQELYLIPQEAQLLHGVPALLTHVHQQAENPQQDRWNMHANAF
ncbi:hypothetical protein HPB50_024874 [Hyalomma asiaticum]|uniref:Uncharacterized protein n=1 Tax=Hyalomma asiaticum TaxID=266040 RepID=A0ACB7RNF3_HYAAI|nr:hypothetical protein HPB50_024874 [Hyalomma asiaticum]